jgi:putative membrane protein
LIAKLRRARAGPGPPRRFWGRLIVGAAALVCGCDGNADPSNAPRAAASTSAPSIANQAALDFIGRAVGDDMFEYQAAQVAAVRAQDPAVKAFAIVTAKQSAASKQALTRAVAESGQRLSAPTRLPDHLQSMLDELNRGTARDFDKTYIEQQIEADEDALSLMSAYGRDGGAPAIRAAASALGPARQAQLDQARSIQDTLNKVL